MHNSKKNTNNVSKDIQIIALNFFSLGNEHNKVNIVLFIDKLTARAYLIT